MSNKRFNANKRTEASILAILMVLMASTSTWAEWSAGFVSGIQKGENYSPFLIPWVQYQNNSWKVDLDSVEYSWADSPIELKSIAELDYASQQTRLTQSFNLPIKNGQQRNSISAEFGNNSKLSTSHSFSSYQFLNRGLATLESGIQLDWNRPDTPISTTEVSFYTTSSYFRKNQTWTYGGLISATLPLNSTNDPFAEITVVLMRSF